MSDKHIGGEAMEIMQMTTEVHQTRPHHLPEARGEDGTGGVVTKPDGGVSFMVRLGNVSIIT